MLQGEMKNPKIFIIIALAFILTITAITLLISSFTVANADKQIKVTLADIQRRADASLEFDGRYLVNGKPLGLSSNPYDYIRGNPEFDKLVAFGSDVQDELEQMVNDEGRYSSLERYILAIAIKEITKTDLKSFDLYFWDNSDVFADKWARFSLDALRDVP